MDLATFATQYSSPAPAMLEELERATWQRTRHGRLMTDAHTGRVLSMISRMIAPDTVLELGTFTGYGTLCLLEGLSPTGTLHTVERNDELFELQDAHWQRAQGHDRIRRHPADSLAFLLNWDLTAFGPIDLAYVDADKQRVNDQLNALLPLLSDRGTVLFDNTWWGGTLYPTDDAPAAHGPKTDALRQLNERLTNDPDLSALVLPVGDGLTVVRKM
jgi:predicted O-methyltransferase YrrM